MWNTALPGEFEIMCPFCEVQRRVVGTGGGGVCVHSFVTILNECAWCFFFALAKGFLDFFMNFVQNSQ